MILCIMDTVDIWKHKSKNVKHKKIICLVSNIKTSIGLLFDESGNLLKRSSLLFEEETEVLEFQYPFSITGFPIS